MFQRIPSSISLRPMVLLLSVAFPFASQAATISADLKGEGVWYLTPTVKTVSATSAAFSETMTRAGNYSTGIATAASDGLGHFGSSAQAINDSDYYPLTTTAHLSFVDSIFNATGSAQAANFGITISTLSFALNSGWWGSTSASFSAKVFINGAATPIWDSSAGISGYVNYNPGNGGFNTEVAPSFAATGTSPLSFTGSATGFIDSHSGFGYTYSLASPYNNTISLGNVAAGDSLSIRYEIDLTAYTYSYGGTVSVVFDDPSHLGLNGAAGALPTAKLEFAQAVPEPETYAMMAAGLGLLAAANRRRKRKASE